jgi:hypothetical protein
MKQEAFGKIKFFKKRVKYFIFKNFFQGAGGEFQPHVEGKQKHGKDTCTPTIKKQIELGKEFFNLYSVIDPDNFKSNANFIPIPKHKNKLLSLKKTNKEVDWDSVFYKLGQMKDFE